MRMWMIDPSCLCRKHLLGEHVECHMLEGTLTKHKSIDGFLDQGILEPASLHRRHRALASEMQRRSYEHNSPLKTTPDELLSLLSKRQRSARVVRQESMDELSRRCSECKERIEGGF